LEIVTTDTPRSLAMSFIRVLIENVMHANHRVSGTITLSKLLALGN
jgi:hypothetical protein